MVAGLIRRANSDNRELAMSEAISDGLVISRAGVGGLIDTVPKTFGWLTELSEMKYSSGVGKSLNAMTR